MSRRGVNASTARNAPFGTDVQPNLRVRIVGGKRMEVAVDSPPSSAGSQKSSGPLQNGPNGTPPMQYQPPVKDGHNNNSIHNSLQPVSGNQRKVYSQTAPSDSSNSHIHGKGRPQGNLPGTPKILPPISPADDSESGQLAENYETIKDILHKPFPVQLPSSPVLSPIDDRRSLTEQVSQHLAGYDPMHFKEMYTDLADFDHGLCGYVSQPQMNMIAHKHQLPIPVTTLRLLFSNFAKETNPDKVNYERLIQFLARAQLGSAKAQTLLQENVNRFVNNTEMDGNDGQTDLEMQRLNEEISRFEEKEREERRQRDRHLEARLQRENHEREEQEKEIWKPSFTPKKPLRTFSDLDDAKLIRMLEEQFTEGKKKGTIDIEGLRQMCLKKDKRQQGTITEKDLQDVCLFYRLPMQGSLMTKMLQRIDCGEGQLSWVAFIEFLERVNSGDALTPRQQSDQRSDQKRLAERSPDISADRNRSTRRSSERTIERSGDKSTSGSTLTVPAIEPIRPNTWPKRPIRDVLPTPAESKQVSSPPWHRKPLARIETRSPEDPDVTSVEMEITRNDTPTDQHVTPSPPPTTPPRHREEYEIEQLRKLARNHQLQQRAQQEEVAMKRQHQEKQEHQEWFKGFLHMAKGLYSNDTTKTGCLQRDEMLRLINNYNLIYQLNIHASHIKRIIDTCCHEGDEVPIQPVLEILRQKRK